jgi:poly(hydroxyalkanoate) depolymerase family esterase
MHNFDTSLAAFAGGTSLPHHGSGRLTRLGEVGANPGDLLGWCHVPADLPAKAPLVVVLHGCTQSADAYDQGSGWSTLADEQGFALLVPEQRRANNPNLCFNWFRPGDATRGRGEAASIRQMIAQMVAAHEIDASRIFVTGLSAGGAMTMAMLAAYPEVFAGGAVIAGLPFGTANSIPEALDRMRGNAMPDRAELAALVTKAARYEGDRPTLSVWHGTADPTVALTNADAIVAQWSALQGLSIAPDRVDTLDGHRRELWHDAKGRARIERVTVAGFGHGTPLATGGEGGLGAAGAHMFEAGINSTRHIARFWGIASAAAARTEPGHRAAAVAHETPRRPGRAAFPSIPRRLTPSHQASGVAEIIDKALRSAGLLR